MTERVPTGITLHQKSRVMEIAFADGRSFRLPYEFRFIRHGPRHHRHNFHLRNRRRR